MTKRRTIATGLSTLIALSLCAGLVEVAGCGGGEEESQTATTHHHKHKHHTDDDSTGDDSTGHKDSDSADDEDTLRTQAEAIPPIPPVLPFNKVTTDTKNPYSNRFITMWNSMHDPANGYFSAQGIPYHSVETLLCEAPDYGHETTSEAFSYWVWLEAMYGYYTNDWSRLENTWAMMEKYLIPTHDDQPLNNGAGYKVDKPATFAPEEEVPEKYPVKIDPKVPVGKDPLFAELKKTYHTADIYGMHWLLDVDNWYGFGSHSDGTTKPSYINTFQRGAQESVWEAIPQPCWDDFKFGSPKGGYVSLFITPTPAKQWKFTDAPDADARAVQAMYWAKTWAEAKGSADKVAPLLKKAAKLGDYLRYALFDKYFKEIGCTSIDCPGAEGYESAHYLLSWYYAWGGALPKSSWSWRIGSSSGHSGYQNPMAAWALANVPELKPKSPNAARDWAKSMDRQLDFYRWVQSVDGPIGGGANNGWNGRYEAPPAGRTTFFGMAYDWSPVFVDPPSNNWFGFQVWSLERVAEFYYVTGNEHAKIILDKFVGFVKKNVRLINTATAWTYEIPGEIVWDPKEMPSMSWDAKAKNWDAADTSFNKDLHAKVKPDSWTNDTGTAAALAKTLMFYAAKAQDKDAQKLAKEIIDRMWFNYLDADFKGVTVEEGRGDYKRFKDKIYVPDFYQGTMPNGDPINKDSTFFSIRSKYKDDPKWKEVEAFADGGGKGKPPKFHYHRFWAQTDVATAMGSYAFLFPDDKVESLPPDNVSKALGKGRGGKPAPGVQKGKTAGKH